MLSLTFGVLPSREQFNLAFDVSCPKGTFSFGNDKRVGTCELDCDELWEELTNAHFHDLKARERASEGPVFYGEWCADVLYCLGIEWI